MYSEIRISKLSETQKSKLRNGHPVRIKKGSGNKLSLTHDQIKKLESAAKKGKAVTITLHQEQEEKYGSGIFGDIATKLKKLAIKNKDLINPIIGRVRGTAKRGVSNLANKANETIDKYISDIEGEHYILRHILAVHYFLLELVLKKEEDLKRPVKVLLAMC
jgi:hypothetical protein